MKGSGEYIDDGKHYSLAAGQPSALIYQVYLIKKTQMGSCSPIQALLAVYDNVCSTHRGIVVDGDLD